MNETYTKTPHLLLKLPELVVAWSTVFASRENPLGISRLSRNKSRKRCSERFLCKLVQNNIVVVLLFTLRARGLRIKFLHSPFFVYENSS